jgi:hypothetical protein
VLGIAQVYVGVMFATTQLLNDATVAGGTVDYRSFFSPAEKAVIVMQVFLLVYELVRQAAGGYITYFDNVAYIRANDVTALRKVRELFAHVNWSERHCQKVVFYTAPYSSTSSVASHINQLVDELSTGRVVQGSNWLTVAGFGNNDGRQAQQLLGDLLFMPTIDAGLFGRSGSSSDNFVYTIKGHRFVANKDGTNIRATDEMPRTRLEVPWMLH